RGAALERLRSTWAPRLRSRASAALRHGSAAGAGSSHGGRLGLLPAVLLGLCLPSLVGLDVRAAEPEHLNAELAHRAFLFFRDETDPHTGLPKDRARLNGGDQYTVASIAATGYALTALPIGVENGWISR